MFFERKSYLQQLISSQGNGMIKIITGIRGCGKSFLLFEIFKRYLLKKGINENHIIEVNLEDRRNQKLRNPDTLLEHIDASIIDDAHYYVLLDDVQIVPEFEDVLNSYLKMSNVDVYVTGSNARFLSKDVITEFRGRGWEIRIHPLSFSEFYEVKGGDQRKALEEYYIYGGLPGVIQIDSVEEKQNYLRNIFETVYLRDVIERNHLKNPEGLKELVRIIASDIGASTNIRRITNTFKTVNRMDITADSIGRYLEYLQDAFIICEAQRYDVKGRKYIRTENKYYFEDLGIRNAAIGFRQIEFNHIMENVIYNELIRLGCTVDVGQVNVYRRNNEKKQVLSKLEVDFVANRADERFYIQSAYRLPKREMVEQEQASLLHISDGFKKMIIDGDRYNSNYNNEGILLIGIYDFLMHGAESYIKR